MPELPFDANAISGTHSQLTSVLAGFALAAFFLLLERIQGTSDRDAYRHYSRAMLLLFIDFILGSVSSFMYSSTTGDPPIIAYLNFVFPSCIFALQSFVLLFGLNIVFSAIGLKDILNQWC